MTLRGSGDGGEDWTWFIYLAVGQDFRLGLKTRTKTLTEIPCKVPVLVTMPIHLCTVPFLDASNSQAAHGLYTNETLRHELSSVPCRESQIERLNDPPLNAMIIVTVIVPPQNACYASPM